MPSATERIDPLPLVARLLPDSAATAGGRLTIAGLDLAVLAARYGTPLYVYDEQTLRSSARAVLKSFSNFDCRVSFASKACDVIAILAVLREEGLGLDVVSEGELTAGLRAGFRPEQIHLHGNNKSDAELDAAIRLGLHSIVVDNLEELERLVARSTHGDRRISIALRVSLPVEAATHPHLQTSGFRSKFGFYRGSNEEQAAIDLLERSPGLLLTGLHTHLGSQISDLDIYRQAAGELIELGRALRNRGCPLEEISTGGGWAVPYRPDDTGLSGEEIAAVLQPVFRGTGFRLSIEPGRAVVARAAVALYRIGSVKHTTTGRIVAVDGGMGDNPRPALYGARYSALLPERPTERDSGLADIVGRYCESGDLLVREAPLPPVRAGDLVCVPVAGAYQLSMASSYNLVPSPAAVLASPGEARLIVRRASIEDLLARNVVDHSEGL